MENVFFYFTKLFPKETGETFLEKEIPYIQDKFDKFFLCVPFDNANPNKHIPQNVEVLYYDDTLTMINKLLAVKYLFSYMFWSEINESRRNLKLKPGIAIIKTILNEIVKAKKIAKYVNSQLASLTSTHKVYLYSYWNDSTSLAISFVKNKYPQIKVFSRAHGWDVYSERHQDNYLPLRNYIFKRLDRIFFISEDGRQYTSLKYPKYIKKFNTAKLGVAKSKVSEYKFNEGLFNIVSCSHIVPLKNISLIIDGLALINSIHINWTHFGTGTELQNIEIRAKEILFERSNISIKFPGFLPTLEVLKYYENNQVDIFINTSLTEGIPVSIMEAMSFGIPVIATAVGGTPEIVKDGYNGYLLSSNPGPEEIANAITYFYNLSLEEKIHLRKNAYNTWFEEYNADKNYKVFVDKIMSL